MLKLPIVVAAYNRPESLNRLLGSLNKAVYPFDVELIISIDGGSANTRVVELASLFEWAHGSKQVITWESSMGLRRHILKCGAIAKQYDGIILLEDDLYVSPQFYSYTIQAHEAYRDDEDIAGVALYSQQYNETAMLPFRPLEDGYDVFFMQLACSWGQSWLRHQWEGFEKWYGINHEIDFSNDSGVPPDVRLWPETSWKKYFLKYIIESNKYFVYPRISLSTNFADPGVNHFGTNIHQVPLLYNEKTYSFPKLSRSLARYDAYCEIQPDVLRDLANGLSEYDFEVDLYGMKRKEDIESEYVVTTQRLSKSIRSFARKLKPHELNLCENMPGDAIMLGKAKYMPSYGQFLLYRNKINQDYSNTHNYFYQITRFHYKSALNKSYLHQKQISIYKKVYRKIRELFFSA